MGRAGKPDRVELRVVISGESARRVAIAAADRRIGRSELVEEILLSSPLLSFKLPDVPDPSEQPRFPRMKTPRSA